MEGNIDKHDRTDDGDKVTLILWRIVAAAQPQYQILGWATENPLIVILGDRKKNVRTSEDMFSEALSPRNTPFVTSQAQ